MLEPSAGARTFRRYAAAALGFLALLAVACGSAHAGEEPVKTTGLFEFPEMISEEAKKIDSIFWLVLYLTGAAFVAVAAGLTWCCLVYRKREGVPALYTHGSSRTALGVTLTLSALVFLGVDMNVVRASNAVAREVQANYPDEDEAIHVKVLAQQFVWNMRWPGKDGVFGQTDPKFYREDNQFGLDEEDLKSWDDVWATGLLVVPVDTPVILEMESKDVIHSFFLPNLRIKQDVVPGMTTRLWFKATKTGEYEIACAELCGLGHYQMRGLFRVVTRKEYDQWMAARAPGQ